MKKGFRKIFKSVRYASRGVVHAYRIDESIRLEVNWGVPAYIAVGYVLWPMTPVEMILFVSSYIFILIVELINTSMEHMLSRVHPEEHEIIGRSKDIASASVLMAFVVAVIVVVMLFCVRFEHSGAYLVGSLFV